MKLFGPNFLMIYDQDVYVIYGLKGDLCHCVLNVIENSCSKKYIDDYRIETTCKILGNQTPAAINHKAKINHDVISSIIKP